MALRVPDERFAKFGLEGSGCFCMLLKESPAGRAINDPSYAKPRNKRVGGDRRVQIIGITDCDLHCKRIGT